MHRNTKILLAGSTGYLGLHIIKELKVRKLTSVLLARSTKKLKSFESAHCELINAEVTDPRSLMGHFSDVDTLISTIGITRQKDGLTYMDVDYQANMNLLKMAVANGVRKFIYISVLNGASHRNLKMVDAKEKFVDALKKSGLEYTVIRPNGFFSDMKDFLKFAEKGRAYLIGNGEKKINPIHGSDLAKVCIDAIEREQTEIQVGGPDILTHNEIAKMAFDAHRKNMKINHIPVWATKAIIWGLRTFTSPKTYGPIEFFLTLMMYDNVAPRYGHERLSSFFKREADSLKKR